MSDPFYPRRTSFMPMLGCLTVAFAFLFMCLLPFFLVDMMQTALTRLRLPPLVASFSVLGILLGSLVNIPVYRFARDQEQAEIVWGAFQIGALSPRYRRLRTETVIAVNVGGCVIPTLLALWQIRILSSAGFQTMVLALVVTLANIAIAWRAARPVPGVGIMMPGLLSPLVAVGLTWLLDIPEDYRTPTAFVAGVMGPLVGADLLHLKDISRVSIGLLSIGGAGTFDGIVLSGLLAALLV